MRILHFYKTSLPDTFGGVEQVISQIAKGTSKLGIKTSVLSLSTVRPLCDSEFDSYSLHRVRQHLQIASTGFSLSAFRRFSQLAEEADVIHYHFPWPFMDLVHFATQVKKPTVVTYHSDIIRQKYLYRLYEPLQRRFLGNVSRIVATSPSYLATSGVLAHFRQKTTVIPIGLDKASYPEPSADRISYWRHRLGQRFFLFVGVMRYYKGLHILLEAAKGSTYPIVVVGDGPLENELKLHAAKEGLRNVEFLGRLPDEDKVTLLMLCYGVLLPSHLRSEAFGISLLEGAMFGKPMVSCEIGTGTTFINIANETGLVVAPNNPRALRQAMDYLWQNPKMAAEMGLMSEARYWQIFTADQMAHAYADLYADVVGGPRLS